MENVNIYLIIIGVAVIAFILGAIFPKKVEKTTMSKIPYLIEEIEYYENISLALNNAQETLERNGILVPTNVVVMNRHCRAKLLELSHMNIMNIVEAINDDAVSIIIDGKTIFEDGKINLFDIAEFTSIAGTCGKIYKKIGSIVKEVRDLTADEIEIIIIVAWRSARKIGFNNNKKV